MRVRLFPYTHVSDAVARGLTRLFDEVTVIRAAGDDPVPSGMTALAPTADEDRRLGALLADWRRFSGLHREGLATYAPGLGRRVDPVDEMLTSQIKSELQRQVKGGPARDEGADSALSARALLSLAAEYDLRCQDLNRELDRIDTMQQALWGSLKGEAPVEAGPLGPGGPEGEVKMEKRLAAWAALFVAEGAARPDRVFVTTSREALALVAEHGVILEELGVFQGAHLGGEYLEALLTGTGAETPVALRGAAGEGGVTVRIFIARREHPYSVFNRFTCETSVFAVKHKEQHFETNENILFVLVGAGDRG